MHFERQMWIQGVYTFKAWKCGTKVWAVREKQGKRVVHDMVDHLAGSGRNITTDNFFTSYELGQELLQENLTLLGTMRQNRGEIPEEMLPQKKREVLSTKFCYGNNTQLASYVPKKNKAVIVSSTEHTAFEISEDACNYFRVQCNKIWR